jgi:hypothetical protein
MKSKLAFKKGYIEFFEGKKSDIENQRPRKDLIFPPPRDLRLPFVKGMNQHRIKKEP